jgi:hypothetical protein
MTEETETLDGFIGGVTRSLEALGQAAEIRRNLLTILKTGLPESDAVDLSKRIVGQYLIINRNNRPGAWTDHRSAYMAQSHVYRQMLVDTLNPFFCNPRSGKHYSKVTLLDPSVQKQLAKTAGKRDAFCAIAQKLTWRVAKVSYIGLGGGLGLGAVLMLWPIPGLDKIPLVADALVTGCAIVSKGGLYGLLAAGIATAANGIFKLATYKDKARFQQDTDAQNICANNLDYLLSRPDKLALKAIGIHISNG